MPMRSKQINLLMWGQQHFRCDVELRMNDVMKELGIPELVIECLLAGARILGHHNRNGVC